MRGVKVSNRRMWAIGIIILTLYIAYGDNLKPKEPLYIDETNFSITLNSGFQKTEAPNFTYFYESEECALAVNHEVLSSQIEIDEYISYIQKIYGFTAENIKIDEHSAIFDFSKTTEGKDIYSYCFAVKASASYWFGMFSCEQKNKDTLPLEDWLTSITVY